MPDVSLESYIALSAVIFALGGLGVLIRRSPLVMLMCVELMWSGAVLAFIAFARHIGDMSGHVFAFFAVIVAAAEVAIGLAIIVVIYRRRDGVDVDDIQLLKG